jgi:hypothetical protein
MLLAMRAVREEPMKARNGFLLFIAGVSALVFIMLASGAAQAETIRALDPRGIPPAVERIPLSPRLAGIKGARIYMVMSWPTNSAFDNVVKDLVPLLKERGPREVTVKPRNVRYSEDDPQLWDEMKQKCDAFIYVAAPSLRLRLMLFNGAPNSKRWACPAQL